MNLNLQCQMMLYLKDSKITNSKKKKKNHHQKRKKKKNESIISNKKLISYRVTQERACTFFEMI